MTQNEQKILNLLQQEAAETARLFSNAGQIQLERIAVAGFLRCLGITFAENEITKRGPEPIDIWFREARFQVTEILDDGRHRNQEIKQRATRIARANHLKDLVEPGIISSSPINPEQLVALVSSRANAKASRYGYQCNNIDLLVYLNLIGRHFPATPLPDYPKSEPIFWRSISVVMEHFAAVLWAPDIAPSFLTERQGQTFRWNEGPDSIFPDCQPDSNATLPDQQKEGKKRMRQFGKVDIPQEAFTSAQKVDT